MFACGVWGHHICGLWGEDETGCRREPETPSPGAATAITAQRSREPTRTVVHDLVSAAEQRLVVEHELAEPVGRQGQQRELAPPVAAAAIPVVVVAPRFSQVAKVAAQVRRCRVELTGAAAHPRLIPVVAGANTPSPPPPPPPPPRRPRETTRPRFATHADAESTDRESTTIPVGGRRKRGTRTCHHTRGGRRAARRPPRAPRRRRLVNRRSLSPVFSK